MRGGGDRRAARPSASARRHRQAGPAPPGPPAPRRGAGAPPAPAAPSLAALERAATILAEARKALGGPALDGVKTLTASGRTKRVRGNNLVPIEFELGIELPDKYFRKDEFPAEETDPTSLGFSGDSLIQTPAPVAAAGRAPGGPPPPTPAQLEAQRKARVNGVKQDFVRFALGMFAMSFETYPLTFAFAAQAEAPQGKADVLDVTGAGRIQAAVPHSQRNASADHGELAAAADERHRARAGTAAARIDRPRRGRRGRAGAACRERDARKKKTRTRSPSRGFRRRRAPRLSSIVCTTRTTAT